ncbi:hypothetical protein CVT26_009173 [Gymnopilus dilepis]|uniref:Uncharacterized protein n=1 Tax=Gymnopilus dilepis TaxID=231916 RepID=A0A409Y9L2_9AGAR|nr:hypothetical protein CVT26_009173 [Gymnopilus dilepis]
MHWLEDPHDPQQAPSPSASPHVSHCVSPPLDIPSSSTARHIAGGSQGSEQGLSLHSSHYAHSHPPTSDAPPSHSTYMTAPSQSCSPSSKFMSFPAPSGQTSSPIANFSATTDRSSSTLLASLKPNKSPATAPISTKRTKMATYNARALPSMAVLPNVDTTSQDSAQQGAFKVGPLCYRKCRLLSFGHDEPGADAGSQHNGAMLRSELALS